MLLQLLFTTPQPALHHAAQTTWLSFFLRLYFIAQIGQRHHGAGDVKEEWLAGDWLEVGRELNEVRLLAGETGVLVVDVQSLRHRLKPRTHASARWAVVAAINSTHAYSHEQENLGHSHLLVDFKPTRGDYTQVYAVSQERVINVQMFNSYTGGPFEWLRSFVRERPKQSSFKQLHKGALYSTRHLLCIKITCVSMEFWCTINDEYCRCTCKGPCNFMWFVNYPKHTSQKKPSVYVPSFCLPQKWPQTGCWGLPSLGYVTRSTNIARPPRHWWVPQAPEFPATITMSSTVKLATRCMSAALAHCYDGKHSVHFNRPELCMLAVILPNKIKWQQLFSQNVLSKTNCNVWLQKLHIELARLSTFCLSLTGL